MPRYRTKEERAQLVEAWRGSGESGYHFARSNGISLNSLKRWAKAIPEEHAFVRLEVASPTAAKITVQVGAAQVLVESGFDRALLRAVVEALS